MEETKTAKHGLRSANLQRIIGWSEVMNLVYERVFLRKRDELLSVLDTLSLEEASVRTHDALREYDDNLKTNCDEAALAVLINAWPLMVHPNTRNAALPFFVRPLYYLGAEPDNGYVLGWLTWNAANGPDDISRGVCSAALAVWTDEFATAVRRALDTVMSEEGPA